MTGIYIYLVLSIFNRLRSTWIKTGPTSCTDGKYRCTTKHYQSGSVSNLKAYPNFLQYPAFHIRIYPTSLVFRVLLLYQWLVQWKQSFIIRVTLNRRISFSQILILIFNCLVGYSAIITVNTYAGDPIDCLTSHPQAPGLGQKTNFVLEPEFNRFKLGRWTPYTVDSNTYL